MPAVPSSPTTPFQRVLSQSRTITLWGGLARACILRARMVPSGRRVRGYKGCARAGLVEGHRKIRPEVRKSSVRIRHRPGAPPRAAITRSSIVRTGRVTLGRPWPPRCRTEAEDQRSGRAGQCGLDRANQGQWRFTPGAVDVLSTRGSGRENVASLPSALRDVGPRAIPRQETAWIEQLLEDLVVGGKVDRARRAQVPPSRRPRRP